MGNSLLLEVDDSIGDIFDMSFCLFFFEGFIYFKMAKKGALFHVFENEVDVLAIIKEAIEFEDVLVVAIVLNFNFLQKLILHEVRFYCFLAYLLQSIEGICLSVEGLIYYSKLAFS